MNAMSGNSDRLESKRRTGWEIFTALLYSGLVVYVGWVTWTQSAALAAPTTAICTAVLLMPRIAAGIEIQTEQWRRPLIAVGTILTGFLWLLSTIQPDAEVLPSNPSHLIVLLLGWSLATSMIVVAPFVVVLQSQSEDSSGDPRRGRIRDYLTGIIASVLAHALGVLMYGVSEDIIGPVEGGRFLIPLLVVSSVLTGWSAVFAMRRRADDL